MKISNITKLEDSFICYDITTETQCFFIKAGDKYILVHNSPSIVFGHHPETKKFFVASKSAFNKNPKINYTPEDIEKNHGHAPGLVNKLKAALEHLPKVTPHGVYQGDLLHTKGDAKVSKGMTSITPNTITYSAPNGSAEAENMHKKLGIVAHTQYKGGKTLDTMSAEPLSDSVRKQFRDHPDVNNVDPSLSVNPKNYTAAEQKEYTDHMENARKAYGKMKPDALDALQGHSVNLEAHVNDMVRKEREPSVQGYRDSISARHEKDLSNTKAPATIQKRVAAHAAAMQHLSDNKQHFEDALALHSHLQKAKNVLTNVMAKNSKYSHSVGGIDTAPEGAVVVDRNGGSSKFVNRNEFSKLNFLRSNFQAANKDKSDE